MNENPLGFEKESKLLRKFAIPSIISMVVSSLYNIVDQIFIGQGVGYLGNAATNVAFPLTTLCLAICLMLGIGSASRFSLNLGAKKIEQVKVVAGNAIVCMIGAGIIYVILVQSFLQPLLLAFGATESVMPYAITYTRITTMGIPFLMACNISSNLIRADGSPRYSMMCMVVGAIVNTILDPLFIFVFHMGVAGAAWATIIGQIVSAFVAVCYLFHFKNITLEKKDIRFSFSELKQTCAIGISSGINQLAILLVQIVMNNSLTYYGALSVYGPDIPLAACGIVMKVNGILMSFVIGISQGMQPIAGFNYGAKKFDRVKNILKLAISLNLAVSAIGWILFEFCTGPILSVFGSEDGLYFEFATKFMHIFLFMCIVNGIQVISSGFFSSIGKPIKGMILSLTRQVLFFIPLVLILGRIFGLNGIMYSAPISDTVAFMVALIFLIKEVNNLNQMHNDLQN
ncbi:MAG: MATE family efflux transporter [Firmicutes bacterium]|nr:MATE family efflux transporter [Bacillota bacterium]